MLDAAQYLADHLHEAPVWIIACLEGVGVHGVPTYWSGSSIYPAVQNMLLVARALSRGHADDAVLASREEVAAALGLPEGVKSYALLPIGYPLGRFGTVRRIPLSEVVYRDRWAQPYAGG